MRAHINTIDGITVVVHNRPYHIAASDPSYSKIMQAVHDDEDDEYINNILTEVRREVEAAVRLSPYMEYSGGVVLHNSKPMHGYAVDRLVAMIHANMDTKALSNFLEKLQLNPSNQTVDNLYEFLEYGRIPLTKSGNFLAYKAIRTDWTDIASGKFDNSIGASPSMPRKDVDDRREHTCSHGLHVCSFEYLPHFAHTGGHVVVVEVNPADVVSIPSDYNNTKMRVCRYTVVGEVEGYYEEHRNVLAEAQVWDPEYTVYARVKDIDEWTEVESFDNQRAAIEFAQTELYKGENNDGQSWSEVKVVDSHGICVFRDRTSD